MITNSFKNNKTAKSEAIILHLDGDRKYAKRALNYYNNLDLKAVVENILIVTGHDKMFKKGQDLYKIENYKNSKYFIETVMIARKWENSQEKLIIFAGACESFYEAIMLAGANFASSPARIMVEYRDPLIIASKIAQQESNKYVRMDDLLPYLKSNYKGIDGSRGKGKKSH